MTRRSGGALCAALGVLGLSSAYADVWITRDGVLERRDETGDVVTTIAQAFGSPIGEFMRLGEVDPSTGNIWLTLQDELGPQAVVRVLGLKPNGDEIWQLTEPGIGLLAIDPGRHGVWVLRAVDPAPSSTREIILYDQTSGARLATINGLGGFMGAVGADGALWIASGNEWVRLQGTTEQLDGYRVVGSVGPRHRTLPGTNQRVVAVDRSDGSLYFGINTLSSSTDTFDSIVVKYSAAGQELLRKPSPFGFARAFSGIEIDPRNGSVYFTTSLFNGSIKHLSSLGGELGSQNFREHVGSLAFDTEDSAPWIGHMPTVDDDQALIAPMTLRKLNQSLVSVVDVPFPGPITVIGAAPATLDISIDIQTQSKQNVVSLAGNSKVRVALLSSASFDPLQVTLDSIRFGTAGAVVQSYWTRDANRDGVTDLIAVFATQHTGIKCGDTAAPLTAETDAGVAVHGSDAVRTQCKK